MYMVIFIFLRGLCGYACVNILTLSPPWGVQEKEREREREGEGEFRFVLESTWWSAQMGALYTEIPEVNLFAFAMNF